MTIDDPWLGQVLGDRYEVVDLIGRGGMAGVYRARDTRLDRFVAVKIFAIGTASDDAHRQAEVDALAPLNHPNLVTLHDAYLAPNGSDSPSYLVMECVEGPNLSSTMERGPVPGPVIGLVAADVAEALVAVHASDLVHRDLKPANILLAPTGLDTPAHRAKLADFGIAHLIGEARVTTTGVVVGTAAYLSPEQARGEEPGPEGDVYALGLVILECLTGERAYPGSVVEALSARMDHDPHIPPEVPVGWASLIGQMTARDPARRPTAAEVALTAHTIAPELRDWLPGAVPGSAVTDTTAAMPPPTQRLPAPDDGTPDDGTPEDGTPEAESRPARGRRPVLGAVLAFAVVAAGAVAAGIAAVLIFQPIAPAVAPPQTTTPTVATSTVPTSAPQPSQAGSPRPVPGAPPGEGETGNNGNGNGNGNANGNGNPNGNGNTNGNGNGNSNGSGTENGAGNGSGTGNGDGSGTEDGNGNGDGSGTGDGNGNGMPTETPTATPNSPETDQPAG